MATLQAASVFITNDTDGTAQIQLVSSRGESHPPALVEPCVNLSVHTAPVVQSSTVTVGRSASG